MGATVFRPSFFRRNIHNFVCCSTVEAVYMAVVLGVSVEQEKVFLTECGIVLPDEASGQESHHQS